jgi:hypothetical protein
MANNVLYHALKRKARGFITDEATWQQHTMKHGGAHRERLTITGGSFSHDEANPRFQKSAVGFA